MPLSPQLQGFLDDPQTMVDTIWCMLNQESPSFTYDTVQILYVKDKEVHVLRSDLLDVMRRGSNHWWVPIEVVLYGAKYLGTREEVAPLRPNTPVVRNTPFEDPAFDGVWRIQSVLGLGVVLMATRQRAGREQRLDNMLVAVFLKEYRFATEEEVAESENLPPSQCASVEPEVVPEPEALRLSAWELLKSASDHDSNNAGDAGHREQVIEAEAHSSDPGEHRD